MRGRDRLAQARDRLTRWRAEHDGRGSDFRRGIDGLVRVCREALARIHSRARCSCLAGSPGFRFVPMRTPLSRIPGPQERARSCRRSPLIRDIGNAFSRE